MGTSSSPISRILTFWSDLLHLSLLTLGLHRNIGVLQTTVAEMVTVKEHQRKKMISHFSFPHWSLLLTSRKARAYTIMPFVWCLG